MQIVINKTSKNLYVQLPERNIGQGQFAIVFQVWVWKSDLFHKIYLFTYLCVFTSSEDSDQPADTNSLIWVLTGHSVESKSLIPHAVQRRRVRQGRHRSDWACEVWSESSLAHVFEFIFSYVVAHVQIAMSVISLLLHTVRITALAV